MEAKAVCQEKGAFLPEPRTQAMRNLMRQARDFPSKFYLGLTDAGHKGQYVWVTDKSPVSDFDWKQGYPAGKYGDCVLRMHRDGWRDVYCGLVYYIVCQKRK